MTEERKRLPITESREEILNAIFENQVVLIRGETGSGKTTQVCEMLAVRCYRPATDHLIYAHKSLMSIGSERSGI
jgi:HrpA-like RNA helicase